MVEQTTVKQPVMKFKDYPLEVSIWENQGNENRVFYTVNLDRNYKDKNDGVYKKSDSLKKEDLLKASNLLQQAYNYIIDVEK